MSMLQSEQSVWQNRVDTDFRHVSPSVLQQFPEARDYSAIEKAAAYHLYVSMHIDYERRDLGNDPRDIRLPEECLEIGAGNCQEKTLLVASLLTTIPEVETRTMGLGREDREIGHRILEVKFNYHPDDVCETLRNFYDRSSHVDDPPSSYGYSHHENQYVWMVADPGTECMGDLSHLRSSGYVIDTDGSWDWYQLENSCHL